MRLLRRFKAPLGLLLLLTVFTAVGGHWCAIQVVAWTRMAISYGKTDKVSVALEKTFDGKHPCRLCHEVVKQQKAAKSEPIQAELKTKLDLFFLVAAGVSIIFRSVDTPIISGSQKLFAYLKSPPTPPPKKSSFLSS